MAINIKKYVDISSRFPTADVAGRSFGGLVFTNKAALPQSADMQEAYDVYEGGGVAYLGLNEVGALFGLDSDEYKFATGYYGYLSPSGRFASRLAFAKVAEGETPVAAFTRVNELTNLFGSFTFLSLAGGGDSDASGDADIEALREVAAYNSGLDTKYLFVVNRVRGDMSKADVIAEAEKFKAAKGTVFLSGATSVSSYMPMAILGSTDYATGQVVNFMFKQFAGEDPTVFDDSTFTDFNAANVNYYGRTQSNGQTLDFYQRGLNSDGQDTAVYCNEMWFKSECETRLMQYLVSNERIPADAVGVAIVELLVTEVCYDAVRNGTFMTKDNPTAASVLGLRQLVALVGGTPDIVDTILINIAKSGYDVWGMLDTNAEGEPIIHYYVFYGTADSIKFIKGDDILIK